MTEQINGQGISSLADITNLPALTTYYIGAGLQSLDSDVNMAAGPTLSEAQVDALLKSLAMFGSERLVVTLTGTNGTATIEGAGGLTKTVTWNTSLAKTAEYFFNENFSAAYMPKGIWLENDGADLIFSNTTHALGMVLSAGTPADEDYFTLDEKTYTLKTVLTPTEGEVLINGTEGSFINLIAAINHAGTPGTDYSCSAEHPTCYGIYGVGALALIAKASGTAGAGIATVAYCPVSEAFSVLGATLGDVYPGAEAAPFVLPTITPATGDLDGTVTNESTSTIYAGHAVDVSGNCAVPSATGLAWKAVLESTGRDNTVTVTEA
jgi:hypothetical protein